MKTRLLLLFLCLAFGASHAQVEMPVTYHFGEKYSDRYKYSNLLAISEDGKGGTVLVRAYYTGLILRPKGYFIEHYGKDQELISEFNYKVQDLAFVDAYVNNGQLYMLFLQYNNGARAYEYMVHHSPIENYHFKPEKLLSIPSEFVGNALDRNYFNRDFTKGVTTTVLFNKEKTAFIISSRFKKRDEDQRSIHLFRANLDPVFEVDFNAELDEKNYALENVALSPDLKTAYLVGKAYFRKKRFEVNERKFQYELLRVDANGVRSQTFDEPGKFSESLIPIFHKGKLDCVGFYADRKDNRYNGIAYFNIDPNTLNVTVKKYNPFSEQFMNDKFGRDEDKEIKNLVFKDVHVTDGGDILFNAEEYFVTHSVMHEPSGASVKIDRYHYNDMVGAKLDANGNMVWARNINKLEVTQNDGAYASYSSYTVGDNTYFFICSAAENPQLINNERLVFRQGLGRNRNVFLIRLDGDGKMDYQKIIDQSEARLPLMVSFPLVNEAQNDLIFYAKRGGKKQLVQVNF